MWGQVLNAVLLFGAIKIIPTRVGTSVRKLVCPCCGLNHPHACGDKAQQWETPPSVTGSSPRVWGQVGCRSSLTMVGRIIPTRVGTSTLTLFLLFRVKDHPHACGDKRTTFYEPIGIKGSSPRVWGQENYFL